MNISDRLEYNTLALKYSRFNDFYHFRSRQGATLELQEEGRRGIRQSLEEMR
jgi:hypothetical protein